MVTLAAGEYSALTDDVLNLWRKEGRGMVGDAYDDESHI